MTGTGAALPVVTLAIVMAATTCCLVVDAGVSLEEPLMVARGGFDSATNMPGPAEQLEQELPWQPWGNATRQLEGMPFELSTSLLRFEYSNDGVVAPKGDVHADTWYPSTDAVGNLVTPFTDGAVNGVAANSAGVSHQTNGSITTTGHTRAIVSTTGGTVGVEIVDTGVFQSSALPYQGRYPCGTLHYKGVWYYGTYALASLTGSAQYPCGNWCVQGPFVGFRQSADGGKTWNEPRMEMSPDFTTYKPSDNFFGEQGPVCDTGIDQTTRDCRGSWKGKVKFGAPHIVDLGQELEYCPDPDGVKRAYVVGHGADKDYQPHSWMHGSQVYMARSTKEVGPEVMADGSLWEFYAGRTQSGDPLWAPTVDLARPLFTWENRTGVVTMTYAPAARKFIMSVSTPTIPSGVGSMTGPFDTYFLEGDTITGPFRMVEYLREFGPQAYFVNVPSRFLAKEGYTGVEGLLSYSANFAVPPGSVPNPPSSGYTWGLLPFRLAGA